MLFRHRFASITAAANVDFIADCIFSCSAFPSLLKQAKPFSIQSSDQFTGAYEDGQNQLLLAACRTAMSKCSLLPSKRVTIDPNKDYSLMELIKTSIYLSPETVRRFWRAPALNPEEVLTIFKSFRSDLCAREVDFLLKLFFWARNQNKSFTHLPKTIEIVISMLIQSQRLELAESLLLEMQANGCYISCMNNHFSDIIEAYIKNWELKNSLAMYDKAKSHPEILLNVSCYKSLLNLLLQLQELDFALTIYRDMLNSGLGLDDDENHVLDFIIKGLCARDNVLEAVNLLKRVRNLGMSCPVRSVESIADGYCRKRDFEDLLKFFKELNQKPGVLVCHRIISNICRVRGFDEAWLFMQNLETLGIFEADAQTLGIFVRWSCREGKLRNASHFISEIYSRSLKPDHHSYNAFLSALAKNGMWECLIAVLAEMKEKKIETGISTFRIVLAGLCMKRRFLEADLVLGQMTDLGFLVSSNSDTVSRVLSVLELNDLQVNVKRDNGLNSSEVEFFDSLGNGLFLSTDKKLLQVRLNKILDDSMSPHFDQRINEECGKQLEASLRIREEAIHMGEILSRSTYSSLLKALANAKPCKVDEALNLLHEHSDLIDVLDCCSLNHLLVAFFKNGDDSVAWGRMILKVLLQKRLPLTAKSFVTVVSNCGNCIDSDMLYNLLFSLQDDPCFVLQFLIKEKMFEKALDFFQILSLHSKLTPDLCCTLVKELCKTGYPVAGFVFAEEIAAVAPLLLEQSCYEYLLEGFCRERKLKEVFQVIHVMPEKYASVSLSLSFWEIINCLLLGFKGQADISSSSCLFKATLLDGLRKVEKYHIGSHHRLNKLCGREMFLPLGSILNLMILHHCSENDSRRSSEIFNLMIKMNVKLGLAAYRSLISLCCFNGYVQFALNLKDRMLRESEVSPLVIYNILIFHLLKNGRNFYLDLVLDDMKGRSWELDEVSWNFLVYGYHRCGDDEKFLDSLNFMISKGMKPSRRNLRISANYFYQQGNIEKALTLCKEMEMGPVALAILTRKLFLSNKLPDAEILLRALQDKDQNSVTSECYDALIPCLCNTGRVDAAVNLLNLILKKGFCPSERSYNLILKGLLSQGVLDLAIDIHAEMLGLGILPRKELSEMILRELCGRRRIFDAEKVLDSMVECGQVPSQAVFQLVLGVHPNKNNVDKELKILQKMQHCGISPEFAAHWSVITNLNRTVNFKEEGSGDRGGFLYNLLRQTGFDPKNCAAKSCSNSEFDSVS